MKYNSESKFKMFYGQEWRYESIYELKIAIIRCINYYNFKRIVTELKRSSRDYLASITKVI